METLLSDPLSLGLIAIAVVLIVFMFISSRRRRRDAEAMRAKIQPGAEVMTSFGLYGTLVSVDEDKNEALVETTPGTVVRVHSQTIAKVVEETETPEEQADDAEILEATGAIEDPSIEIADEPEFGERTDTTNAAEKPKRAPRSPKKPTE
ncbi:preprotein translocase subunit YajC [Pseudolysinimonas sp.]